MPHRQLLYDFNRVYFQYFHFICTFAPAFLITVMAKQTEEDKILYRINKRFLKGVVDYGLIRDGDKILVGLSGGKDSMALMSIWLASVNWPSW